MSFSFNKQKKKKSEEATKRIMLQEVLAQQAAARQELEIQKLQAQSQAMKLKGKWSNIMSEYMITDPRGLTPEEVGEAISLYAEAKERIQKE